MNYHRSSFLVAAALLAAALVDYEDAAAQCNGQGRGGGMQTGSPAALATNWPYSQNPLASIGNGIN